MAGRKPVPTALKKLRGNPGRRPLNKREPKPSECDNVPACPRYLKSDAVAAARWDYDASQLVQMKVLTEADQGALEMRSYVYSQIYELREILRVEGRVVDIYVKDKNEVVYLAGQKSHPAAVQLAALLKEFRAYGSLLGLDPASRSKIKVGTGDDGDEFDKMSKARVISGKKGSKK